MANSHGLSEERVTLVAPPFPNTVRTPDHFYYVTGPDGTISARAYHVNWLLTRGYGLPGQHVPGAPITIAELPASDDATAAAGTK